VRNNPKTNPSETLCRLSGSVALPKFVQPANAKSSIAIIPFGTSTRVSPDLVKAFLLMLVTLLGITTVPSRIQWINALSPIFVKPSGNTMLVRFVHSKNAAFSIL
jgi:hypothetical protein